jgi:hypothetical protein
MSSPTALVDAAASTAFAALPGVLVWDLERAG